MIENQTKSNPCESDYACQKNMKLMKQTVSDTLSFERKKQKREPKKEFTRLPICIVR